MADFWLQRRGEYPSLEAPQPAFNWAGVIAYVVASAIAYFTGKASLGIAPINGIIAAVILYVVLSRVLPQQTTRSTVG